MAYDDEFDDSLYDDIGDLDEEFEDDLDTIAADEDDYDDEFDDADVDADDLLGDDGDLLDDDEDDFTDVDGEWTDTDDDGSYEDILSNPEAPDDDYDEFDDDLDDEDDEDAEDDYDDYDDERPSRRPLLIIGAALVVLALAIGGVFLFNGSKHENNQTGDTIIAQTTEQTTEPEVISTEEESSEPSTTTTSSSAAPSTQEEKVNTPVTNPQIGNSWPMGAVAGFLDGFYQKRDATTALTFFRPNTATVKGTDEEIAKLPQSNGQTQFVVTPIGNWTYKVDVSIPTAGGPQTLSQNLIVASGDGNKTWYVDKIIRN